MIGTDDGASNKSAIKEVSDSEDEERVAARRPVRMPIPRSRATSTIIATPVSKVPKLEQPSGRASQAVTKTRDAVTLRPKKGKLTLLARRFFNALLYHAQLQDKSNPGQDRYSVPLSKLVKDARFTSHNTQHVKDLIVEMQGVQIQWETHDEAAGKRAWHSVPLIGGVTIEVADKRGSDPVIHWSYDPLSRALLVDPVSQYTRILLEISAQARSYAAAALYEIGVKYLTSPNGLTMREDLEWWIPVLTGNSVIPAEFEYGVFKRDRLRGALAEVDALSSEFRMELIEHKRGRKVEQLQFRVLRKSRAEGGVGLLALLEPLDLTLVERLVALGLKRPDAEDLCAMYPSSQVESTVEHVEQRVANAALPPIQSVPAFLRHALQKGYVGTSPEEPVPPAAAPVESSGQLSLLHGEEHAGLDDRRSRGEGIYATMTTPELDDAMQRFEQEQLPQLSQAIAKHWHNKRLDSKLARAQFILWLADTATL